VLGTDRNFYGTTQWGGNAGDYGTVFRMTPAGSVTTLANFNSTNGSAPKGALIQGSNGSFYGATQSGGGTGFGTIFQVTTSGSLTSLYSFDFTYAPSGGGLILGNDGNFYGTTYSGYNASNGSVFKMTPGGSVSTLAGFSWTSIEDGPQGRLLLASDGNFYGTTAGRTNGKGDVYKMSYSGSTTPMSNFNGTNGSQSLAGLVQGVDGNFYGTTSTGGANNAGTVFQMTPAGALTTLCSFNGAIGSSPKAELVQGADGNFYGTTYSGGASNDGTIFMITASGSLSTLYSFSGSDGANPQGALVPGPDGGFYGTATNGGANSCGTVFTIIPFDVTATLGMPFSYQITAANTPTGYGAMNLPSGLSLNPSSGLISGTPTLVGATTVSISATNAAGTGSATLMITVLPQLPVITSAPAATGSTGFNFNYQITATNNPSTYSSGPLPAGLTLNPSTGLISGTVASTGTSAVIIIAANPAGAGSESLTLTFVQGPPIITSPPSVTGTNGGGFSYQITALNNPTGFAAIGLPSGLNLNAATGLITGITASLGNSTVTISASNASGVSSASVTITVVQMPPPGLAWPLSTICSFASSNGANPMGGVIQGYDGNFYGTTDFGGSANQGTVFKVTPGGSLSDLVSFNYATNGAYPFVGLVQAQDGGFYGTTQSGGAGGYGTIFDVTTSGSMAVLRSLNASTGSVVSGLVRATDGNFYGHRFVSAGDSGYVFKLTPGGSLSDVAGFQYPWGFLPVPIFQGANGNIYGAVSSVFSYEGLACTVFEMTPFDTASIIATLYTGFVGTIPTGLVQGANGNLYGTTYNGGASGDGTIFMLTSSGSFTLLHSFNGADGAYPCTGIIQGSDGNFYGTTYSGGAGNDGTVFMMTPAGSLTTLYSFSGADGANPEGPLFQAANGVFYGTAYYGGANNYGTVFGFLPFNVTATLGVPFAYQIRAVSNTPTGCYAAANLPAGLSLNTATGLISGTPVALGATTAAISATNPGGAGSAPLTITVVPATPVIASPLIATGITGVHLAYQIGATNCPATYSAIGLPAGFTLNAATGVINGSTMVPGSTCVTITAINSSGSASATLTINILKPPPVITSSSTASVVAGRPFSYQITATNNPISYSVSNCSLPGGLNLDTSTGLISGVSTYTGTSTATITANNLAGSGTATLTLIPASPNAPQITSPSTVTGTNGSAFTYQITATNNPTGYSALGLPVGLNLNATNGLISGTAGQFGSTTATISAANASGTGSAALTITGMASLSGWRDNWFTPAQLADPATCGDNATPANDGVPNLLKYAFNVNPLACGLNAMPVSSLSTINGLDYLTMTYTQNIFATDITYIPEVSSDLQNWEYGPVFILSLGIVPNPDGQTETVTVQDLMPSPPGVPRFIHLKVTRP
jgi:uncharacterized repeat protein (TIGR03803 family)